MVTEVGWYFELACFYDKEKDEYFGWVKLLSFTQPNAGRGVRNVRKVYMDEKK